MRPVIRLSLFGILAGMSLWLVGCSKTEDAPATPSASSTATPTSGVTADGKKAGGGGVVDLTDGPAPSGVKAGVDNGKMNSAPPKGGGQGP